MSTASSRATPTGWRRTARRCPRRWKTISPSWRKAAPDRRAGRRPGREAGRRPRYPQARARGGSAEDRDQPQRRRRHHSRPCRQAGRRPRHAGPRAGRRSRQARRHAQGRRPLPVRPHRPDRRQKHRHLRGNRRRCRRRSSRRSAARPASSRSAPEPWSARCRPASTVFAACWKRAPSSSPATLREKVMEVTSALHEQAGLAFSDADRKIAERAEQTSAALLARAEDIARAFEEADSRLHARAEDTSSALLARADDAPRIRCWLAPRRQPSNWPPAPARSPAPSTRRTRSWLPALSRRRSRWRLAPATSCATSKAPTSG